jgi:hypothetical protein
VNQYVSYLLKYEQSFKAVFASTACAKNSICESINDWIIFKPGLEYTAKYENRKY